MPTVGPIRLTKEDHDRLMDFVRIDGRTQADILRDAVIKYIDGYNTVQDDQRLRDRDRVIADALKSIENRFALLLVRLGVDLESLYAFAWALTAEQEDQDELFAKCAQVGLERFRRKLIPIEKQMVDTLVKTGPHLKATPVAKDMLDSLDKTGPELKAAKTKSTEKPKKKES